MTVPRGKKYPLGRTPGVSAPGRLMLTNYMEEPLPVWNGNDDFTINAKGQTIKDYGMLGNGPDPLVTNQGPGFVGAGDCGLASDYHTNMINALTAFEAIPPVSGQVPNEVVAEYFVYDGGQDNGVDLWSWLTYRLTHTLAGLPKLAGIAQVNPHGQEFQAAIHLFGVGYAGILVSSEAMNQAENDPPQHWTSLATDWIGGHAVPIVARNASIGKCITWGFVQEFSWPWWKVAAEEMFVILSPEIMATPGGVYHGVAVAKLKEDIQKLKGTL